MKNHRLMMKFYSKFHQRPRKRSDPIFVGSALNDLLTKWYWWINLFNFKQYCLCLYWLKWPSFFYICNFFDSKGKVRIILLKVLSREGLLFDNCNLVSLKKWSFLTIKKNKTFLLVQIVNIFRLASVCVESSSLDYYLIYFLIWRWKW